MCRTLLHYLPSRSSMDQEKPSFLEADVEESQQVFRLGFSGNVAACPGAVLSLLSLAHTDRFGDVSLRMRSEGCKTCLWVADRLLRSVPMRVVGGSSYVGQECSSPTCDLTN